MITKPFIYVFKRGNSADYAVVPYLTDGKRIGLHQIFNDQLFLIPGLHICHKYFVWFERLYKLHLVGEDIRLVFVVQIIVDHTPDGCFARTGGQCDDLYRVLSIENIVDSVSTADLYRIDLVQIKMSGGIQHMLFRNITLVLLIGYEVLDGNLFKVDIWYKHTIIFH